MAATFPLSICNASFPPLSNIPAGVPLLMKQDSFLKSPRCRQVANKAVQMDTYANALEAWMTSQPLVNIMVKVGPVLCTDARQVTPGAFQSICPLLKGLIHGGCSNGVLQSMKLREGMLVALMRHKELCGDHPIEDIVAKVCGHVCVVMGLLRETKFEECHQTSISRRFPRSGGFRKKCLKANVWHLVQEILLSISY